MQELSTQNPVRIGHALMDAGQPRIVLDPQETPIQQRIGIER
jgi:hypothetical protein